MVKITNKQWRIGKISGISYLIMALNKAKTAAWRARISWQQATRRGAPCVQRTARAPCCARARAAAGVSAHHRAALFARTATHDAAASYHRARVAPPLSALVKASA
jgi:hypothetical protein